MSVSPLFTMLWGAPGDSIVPDYNDQALLYVPATEIWIVDAAGIVLDATPSQPCDFKLQYQIKDTTGASGGWLVPLAVNVGDLSTTPVMALGRRLILPPDTRLSARAAWNEPGVSMALLIAGFKAPYSQATLDQLVLGGGGASAPDLSGFLAQCQAAGQALSAIQQP